MTEEYTKDQCLLETKEHIEQVKKQIGNVTHELNFRASVHDASKLAEPELSVFTKYTPALKGSTYGSEEYNKNLAGMSIALTHHYASNSHHPEHYDDGVNGMDLFDITEMYCDWKAAVERHEDGNIYNSLEHNRARFNIDGQLYDILLNTIVRQALKHTKVIAGFPGVGKSFTSEREDCLDLESSSFSWLSDDKHRWRNPNFPLNYVDELLRQLASGKYKYIFVSTHKESLEFICRAIGYNNLIVFAPVNNNHVRAKYLERYKQRGNDESFINLIDNKWNEFLDDINSLKERGTKVINLTADEYVSTFLDLE